MNHHLYGCQTPEAGYFDVSHSLARAKQWATQNGHSAVYRRWHCGYTVTLEAVKEGREWVTPIPGVTAQSA